MLNILREEVANYGVTFKQLASAVCVAPSTMSQYVGGSRPMPKDVEAGIINRLQSPRLSEERCANCQGNMFPTRYLDNVDDHPIVALNKLHEETREVLANIERVKRVLMNKRKGSEFTEADIEALELFENEVADIITCGKTMLIKLQEWYGRPVIGTMQRHVEKLEREEYCTKRKSPVAAGL